MKLIHGACAGLSLVVMAGGCGRQAVGGVSQTKSDTGSSGTVDGRVIVDGGPTADGRPKPDLLAPGEGISSPVPGGEEKSHDGTSQATPHVSGVAALLLGRYPELRGDPLRVKQILCDTANDLNRDRYFQGHGMVDALRALQSI